MAGNGSTGMGSVLRVHRDQLSSVLGLIAPAISPIEHAIKLVEPESASKSKAVESVIKPIEPRYHLPISGVMDERILAQRGISVGLDSIDMGPGEDLLAVEQALVAIFAEFGLPRLGGASGDLGWSSFSTFQKCPYLWKRMYQDDLKRAGKPAVPLEVGSTVHTFAAVFYQKMINPDYPLTPTLLYERLLDSGCNVESVLSSWRYWQGYAFKYERDCLIPLAVEYHIVDHKTHESARYDLIARIDQPGDLPMVPGTYVVEHKTAGRFDDATLDGWRNDGEVLGQITLWKRLDLDAIFGPLRGVMVNIIGKQKIQQFHRTVVSVQSWQSEQHTEDLRHWQGLKQLMISNGIFPRSRANCIGRYGKCVQWSHCSGDEGALT